MDKLEQIKFPISKEIKEYKRLFDSSLHSSNPLLNEVLTYIKQRNGKMMRPVLTLLMAKLYGEISESTYHAALSLELLHTASLVHDDVVDESDKRRGQLSVNAVYDNKVSVLVGDYLLATSLNEASMTEDMHMVKLVSLLGQNLSEGEIIQLSNTDSFDFSEEVYYDVIRKKTAALFAACAEAGTRLSDENVETGYLFGEMIGIAFQIKDDIFDYFSSTEIGKPTGNDMREGKLTLPALYVLRAYPDDEMRGLALRIRSMEVTDTEISRFIDYVKANGGIEYAAYVMDSYRDKALALLPKTADPVVKEALTAYVDYAVDRTK